MQISIFTALLTLVHFSKLTPSCWHPSNNTMDRTEHVALNYRGTIIGFCNICYCAWHYLDTNVLWILFLNIKFILFLISYLLILPHLCSKPLSVITLRIWNPGEWFWVWLLLEWTQWYVYTKHSCTWEAVSSFRCLPAQTYRNLFGGSIIYDSSTYFFVLSAFLIHE